MPALVRVPVILDALNLVLHVSVCLGVRCLRPLQRPDIIAHLVPIAEAVSEYAEE